MSPRAIIVTIGSEILFGDIVDINAAWLSRALVSLGIEPVAHETVGDAEASLMEALRRALDSADVVVTTGGLGPTADDTTRRAAALATGRNLELRPELLEPIRHRLASRGREMSENNRRQAYMPAGAEALPNPVGTAPGFVVGARSGPMLVCLPGIPFEVKQVWRSGVEPILRRRFPMRGALAVRVLRCVGAGESEIDRLLGELALGTTTAALAFQLIGGEIHIRLIGQGATEGAALESLAPLEAEVRSRLGRLIYGDDDDTLAGVVIRRLKEMEKRLAVVEGVTSGALVSALAGADLDGAVFVGGKVAPEATIWNTLSGGKKKEPGEGEARALALARLAASEAGVEVGLASTGVFELAEAEAVATYYMAAIWGEKEQARVVKTSGPTDLVHRRAALGALDLLRRMAYGWPETGP